MRVEMMWIAMGVTLWAATPCLAEDVPPQTEEAEQASMELIEFLGSWQTVDGEWVDPFVLVNLPLGGQEPDDED